MLDFGGQRVAVRSGGKSLTELIEFGPVSKLAVFVINSAAIVAADGEDTELALTLRGSHCVGVGFLVASGLVRVESSHDIRVYARAGGAKREYLAAVLVATGGAGADSEPVAAGHERIGATAKHAARRISTHREGTHRPASKAAH